jgi:RNA recognition motif-containing protein
VLREIVEKAGPFKEFKLKTDPKNNKLMGFGFCQYVDPDVAASALRNLKATEIKGRALNVDFASEHKSGTNLRVSDVLYRDKGEVVNPQGLYVDPACASGRNMQPGASVEDVLSALTPEQEHMLLYAMKEAY